jgi:hypothetical protein
MKTEQVCEMLVFKLKFDMAYQPKKILVHLFAVKASNLTCKFFVQCNELSIQNGCETHTFVSIIE